MVDCCLGTDGLGYEVFNVANDDMSVGTTSDEVYERFYADVPRRARWVPTRRFTPTTRPSASSDSLRATHGATNSATTNARRECAVNDLGRVIGGAAPKRSTISKRANRC